MDGFHLVAYISMLITLKDIYMKYNYQNYPGWKDSSMSDGVFNGQKFYDKFGDYGCLVSSLANIIALNSNHDYTPGQLNDTLKTHKGYYFYSGKATSIDNTSFLDWDSIEKLFLFKHSDTNDINNNDYLIAKVQVGKYNHYLNIIKYIDDDRIICYDVWMGDLKTYKRKEFLSIIKIEFLK